MEIVHGDLLAHDRGRRDVAGELKENTNSRYFVILFRGEMSDDIWREGFYAEFNHFVVNITLWFSRIF